MKLTKRELDVLTKLAEGHTVKEIAKILYVEPCTIVTHKKNIYIKTKTRTLVQLGAAAVRQGLIA